MVLSIVISETHSYIPPQDAVKEMNWVRTIDRTMELQWNVRFVSDQILQIVYFLTMFFYKENKVNRTTVVAFVILSVIEIVKWFHDYKTLNYGSVYVWTLGVWLLVYYQYFIVKAVKRSLKKLIKK